MPEVCSMNTFVHGDLPRFNSMEHTFNYFVTVGGAPEQRCINIISKSESLGDYDFFFVWFENSKKEQLSMLIQRIDETLEPLGAKYTITTK